VSDEQRESLDAYLDRVLIGGPESVPIVVVDYDPGWAVRYESERRRIIGALGVRAVKVEHIGSTSVPGLAAKPVVDILVTVGDAEDEAAYIAPLIDAGYVLRVREDNHRMLRTPEKDVHAHVHSDGDDEAHRLLLLRSWLRGNDAEPPIRAGQTGSGQPDLADNARLRERQDRSDPGHAEAGRSRGWQRRITASLHDRAYAALAPETGCGSGTARRGEHSKVGPLRGAWRRCAG